MQYKRMLIEAESPEELGYHNIKNNLAESSVSDLPLHELGRIDEHLLLAYGDHRGLPELRKKIAKDEHIQNPDDILITTGAINALFIVNTALLSPADHLLVMSPNYPTAYETPRAIGCEIDYLKIHPHHALIDRIFIENHVKQNTTLISVTSPHNPTGKVISLQDLHWLIEFTAEKNIYLLVDETYREIPFGARQNTLSANLANHVISVTSLSKAYGLPGLRIGWMVCKNQYLNEKFLAAKEQMVLCNSVVDEQLALNALVQKNRLLHHISDRLEENFQILTEWASREKRIEVNFPEAGCVALCEIKNKIDTAKFYSLLLETYSTYLGRGKWFEIDDHFFRLGFGWPTKEELAKGLQSISMALNHF